MEELDTLMASGKQCEESECSVDDVDMLIGDLLDQQRELYGRVKQLKTEIKLLEELNEGDRNVDEIQETVRAIARIFQLGVSCLVIFFGWSCLFMFMRSTLTSYSLNPAFLFVCTGQGEWKRLSFPQQAHRIFWRGRQWTQDRFRCSRSQEGLIDRIASRHLICRFTRWLSMMNSAYVHDTSIDAHNASPHYILYIILDVFLSLCHPIIWRDLNGESKALHF